MSQLLKVVVDSNGFDGIVDSHPEAIEVFADAVMSGRLEFVITHIQSDEIEATPDGERRAKLKRDMPPTSRVPTSGAVWDVSRFDEATFAGPDQIQLIDTVAGPTRIHINDALILSTARDNGWPLLTNDKRLRAMAEHFEVRHLWLPDLLELLDEHGDD
jgi:predicted nucleic acid-binding protein